MKLVYKIHMDEIQQIWGPLRSCIPQTVDVVTTKLRGLAALVTDAQPPSLVYLFSQDDETFAHRGYAPASSLPEISRHLPVSLIEFYEVHDGWVDLFSGDMGLLPTGDWQVIGREEGVSDGFLELFLHGGSALGFDLDNSPPTACILWSDGNVENVDDFWGRLDRWIALNLEDMDDNDTEN